MHTGVESFSIPTAVGPIYPFVGSEVLLTIVGVALWIIWHVWQIRSENKGYEDAVRKIREGGKR